MSLEACLAWAPTTITTTGPEQSMTQLECDTKKFQENKDFLAGKLPPRHFLAGNTHCVPGGSRHALNT
jgi:hypothetical protein